MVLNVFPFSTKLQNHTQPVETKKKVLGRKVGQEQRLALPRPTSAYTLTHNVFVFIPYICIYKRCEIKCVAG